NDPGDRLALFSVPPSPAESGDAALAGMNAGDAIVTWPDVADGSVPDWLGPAPQMHWVRAPFSNARVPPHCTQPYRLLTDCDGVVFFSKVTAETVPEIGKGRAP